jgi:hypothetical protein
MDLSGLAGARRDARPGDVAAGANVCRASTLDKGTIMKRTMVALAALLAATGIAHSQTSTIPRSSPSHRPPWKVAGVDYYVGVPTELTLKNPSTISVAGVKVGSRSITITGNNVTLDGYDFSGWMVVTSGANTRLINSKFDGVEPGGTQSSVISGLPGSSNLYVGFSTIDGLSGAGGRAEFLVEMEGPGLTVEYSWLRRSNSDIIGRHGKSGGGIVIQNNLIEQSGMTPGTHGDYLQVYGPTLDSISILFNTAVQNGGTTQGFFADNTKTAEIAGNTMIGSVNYWVSGSGPDTKLTTLTGPFAIHDNYFDVSQAYGFAYGPSYQPDDGYALSSFTHNVNMVTGQVLQDSNASTVPWSANDGSARAPAGTPQHPSLLAKY